MFDETAPDPELNQEQLELISELTEDEILVIDNQLYSNTSNNWRKIARIVGTTMIEMPQRPKGVPDIFYALRVRHLVQSGKLEYKGYLNRMRYCEVRRSTNET